MKKRKGDNSIIEPHTDRGNESVWVWGGLSGGVRKTRDRLLLSAKSARSITARPEALRGREGGSQGGFQRPQKVLEVTREKEGQRGGQR